MMKDSFPIIFDEKVCKSKSLLRFDGGAKLYYTESRLCLLSFLSANIMVRVKAGK